MGAGKLGSADPVQGGASTQPVSVTFDRQCPVLPNLVTFLLSEVGILVLFLILFHKLNFLFEEILLHRVNRMHRTPVWNF